MKLRNALLPLLFLGVASAAEAGGYNLDTPISAIASDPKAAAVVDKNIPGLLSNENFDIFKQLSLKQVSALSGGKLTHDMLDRTQAELDAIPMVQQASY